MKASTKTRRLSHRFCVFCGTGFVTFHETKIFCSRICCKRHHAQSDLTTPQRHISRTRSYARLRYQRYKNAEGEHTLGQWVEQLDRFGWQCVYCEKILTDKTATRDHFIAITNGGTNYIWNIVPACRECNTKKKDRDPFSIFSQAITTSIVEKLALLRTVGRLPDEPDYHLNKWRHSIVDQGLAQLAAAKRMPSADLVLRRQA